MKIRTYQETIELSNNCDIYDIINNHNLLTEQLRRYFKCICFKEDAHNEETSYRFKVDVPYSFGISENQTNSYIGVFEQECEGILFFETKFGGWEEIDFIPIDDLVVIAMELESINYHYN